MRNLLSSVVIAMVMAQITCSCNRDDHSKQESKSCNAAMELYCKYANNANLTVAYLGDMTLKEKDIDALMLQATDDYEWQMLRQDFELASNFDSIGSLPNMDVCSDDSNRISVGIGIETDFLEILGLDSTVRRDQITEADIRKVSESVAQQLKDILLNFQDVDTTMIPEAAIIIGDGPVTPANNMSIDEYINTVAEALTQSIIDEFFTQQDSLNLVPNPIPENHELLDNAKSHGHSGYVTAADYKNRAVWLFFYDDQEECNVILTHIKNDIIVASYEQ